MPRDAPITWRPAKELRARLEAFASDRGDSVTATITDLVSTGLDAQTETTQPKTRRRGARIEPPRQTPGRRDGLCPHRRRPDEFCSRCDT